MIANFSKNGVGLVLLVLSWAGLSASETDIQEFIAASGQVVSFLMLLWNQIDRKDTKWFLWKTPERD